eukprot:1236768-Rhodomonas_salina.1
MQSSSLHMRGRISFEAETAAMLVFGVGCAGGRVCRREGVLGQAHPGLPCAPVQGRHPDHHLAVRQHGAVRDLRSHRRPDCCPLQ